MKVFKFGGASVKDAAGVRNLAKIIRNQGADAIVVVSAMGKTTNALEALVRAYVNNQPDEIQNALSIVIDYHTQVMNDLAGDFGQVHQTFAQLRTLLALPSNGSYDEIYDQIVSLGEIISTQIIATFLEQNSIPTHWLDARQLVCTTSLFGKDG